MKITDLKPNPNNPRTVSAEKLAQLEKNLTTFGDLSGVVFNRRTGHLISGHQRLKVMPRDAIIHILVDSPEERMGYVEVDKKCFFYREVDWDVELETAAMIAANKNAGEWDIAVLTDCFSDLGELDFDLSFTMFDENEIEELLHGKEVSFRVKEKPKPDERDDEVAEDEFDSADDIPELVPSIARENGVYECGDLRLYVGDCLKTLSFFEPNSVDSLVTDPPAGIAFMGKDWDKDKGGRDQWVSWMTDVMRECHRVMKPGAHGLVWAIPRTSHWTATALENAGFEVRDVVTHLFGSGFPKSLDISKAIDKAAGAEREVVGSYESPEGTTGKKSKDDQYGFGQGDMSKRLITAPATDAAKQWDGWGTALKPASEHWVLVRKPISEKTVAANVLKWGTGGINIDGCRISVEENDPNKRRDTGGYVPTAIKATTPNAPYNSSRPATLTEGRFPANLILDEEAAEMLDAQSGNLGTSRGGNSTNKGGFVTAHADASKIGKPCGFGDSGGASRFFYVAKASKKDKGAGNTHPTVKPIKLMDYLVTLVTPPYGVVLDPFNGTGTTGLACSRKQFKYIGCEKEIEYADIALARWGYDWDIFA